MDLPQLPRDEFSEAAVADAGMIRQLLQDLGGPFQEFAPAQDLRLAVGRNRRFGDGVRASRILYFRVGNLFFLFLRGRVPFGSTKSTGRNCRRVLVEISLLDGRNLPSIGIDDGIFWPSYDGRNLPLGNFSGPPRPLSAFRIPGDVPSEFSVCKLHGEAVLPISVFGEGDVFEGICPERAPALAQSVFVGIPSETGAEVHHVDKTTRVQLTYCPRELLVVEPAGSRFLVGEENLLVPDDVSLVAALPLVDADRPFLEKPVKDLHGRTVGNRCVRQGVQELELDPDRPAPRPPAVLLKRFHCPIVSSAQPAASRRPSRMCWVMKDSTVFSDMRIVR